MGFTFERSGGFQEDTRVNREVERMINGCFVNGNYDTLTEALDAPFGDWTYRRFFTVSPILTGRDEEVPFLVQDFNIALRQRHDVSPGRTAEGTPVDVGRATYDLDHE